MSEPALRVFRLGGARKRRLRLPRKLSWAILAAAAQLTAGCASLAQDSGRAMAAPARDVEFTLTPELDSSGMRALRVEMRFSGDSDGETTLVLPDNPDLPETRYREGVAGLSVSGASMASRSSRGAVLSHRPHAPIEVTYRIVETAPGMPFTTQIRPTGFATVGEAVFSRIQGRDGRVKVRWGMMPAGWALASDLRRPLAEGRLSWDELLESTIVAGSDLSLVRQRVGQGELLIAMPDDADLDKSAFAALVGRIAAESNALWRDRGGNYLITLATLDFPGQAGLGRGSGYALYLPRKPDLQELHHTLAHEYLHTWIGRRFGGGKAWFREGFTEFYARRIDLRAQSYDVDQFIRGWNDALLRYARSDFRAQPDAVTEAKFFSDKDAQRLGEDRGSMMAALFDYRIRAGSGGRLGLTDVLLEVKRQVDRKAGRGDGPGRLVDAARRLARVDLQPDLDRYVTRGEPLLLPPDLFGGCASVKTITLPNIELGFAQPKRGEAVRGLPEDGPAYAAGLRDGMVFLGAKLGLTPGVAGSAGSAEMEFRVRDGDRERTIRFEPATGAPTTAQTIRLRPAPDAAAAAACARALAGRA
ncbi:MAG: hypothetical protein QOG72_2624 [Sphingomonadales bacterium]|jgi:predicted metalloprotease with PDZ domain|nr:hypothetical protein [Sphingomonadales bacterium]